MAHGLNEDDARLLELLEGEWKWEPGTPANAPRHSLAAGGITLRLHNRGDDSEAARGEWVYFIVPDGVAALLPFLTTGGRTRNFESFSGDLEDVKVDALTIFVEALSEKAKAGLLAEPEFPLPPDDTD